ncbi:Capsule polysaccharide biosynthesis protein [Jannaschia faecimaris]|uniref:Capsule polysaccharide biosynthesis protein n=1 Tax=Jannaschia faecimaris TaxID=1244108 RepID=A0A1H3JQQ2_9RHOB|nr:hypothetical protein [Jannaschia faecimaris]SDY42217.1 Capsule polysaccharide biosynthesis protein [Jannaschia faecimaris]
MTMRLMVVSTATNTDAILEKLVCKNKDIKIALHMGHVTADIKASAITRMNTRQGGKGHLFAKQRWTGAGQALIESPDFLDQMETFIDHLHRRSDINAHKNHPLRTMQDYVDYYHILADVIGQALIDKGITHCLFFNVPHLTYDTIVFQMAKVLDIPCTIVTESLFPDRFFSLRDPHEFGRFPPDLTAKPFAIEQGSRPDLFYMQGIKQEPEAGGRPTLKGMAQIATFLALKRPLKALNPAYLWRLTKDVSRIYGGLPKWRDPFAKFFHEDALEYFDHLTSFEDQVLNLDGDFVYFPLQLQPEMTTSSLGGRFRDQAHAIETLADMLPKGVRILVKENPKQGSYMRGPMFFHRLGRIASVTLLPSWADTHALTAKARFVASITGTVGWEAIRQGTPALVFGSAWYRGLPGVHHIEDAPTYEAIRDTQIDHYALQQAVGALLARSHRGLVDRHYVKMIKDFDEEVSTAQTAKIIGGLLKGSVPLTFPGH